MKKDDHQKGHSRKNTANIGGAAYAPQQDEPHSKGDARTPNKPEAAKHQSSKRGARVSNHAASNTPGSEQANA